MKPLETLSTRQLEFYLSNLEKKWDMVIAMARKNKIESKQAEIVAILGRRRRTMAIVEAI